MARIRRVLAVGAVAALSAYGGATFSPGAAAPADPDVVAPGPAEVAPAVVPDGATERGPAEAPAGVPVGAQRGVVERIVDGDTIHVRSDEPGGPLVAGASHAIRLLQIDTPETVHPSRPVQCGGPEATLFAEERLPVGATVWLEADQEDTDRYGRFLRYVYEADGTMFNERALREGVAHHRIYPPNERHAARLSAASAEAVGEGRGLHGPPCGGAAAVSPAVAPPAEPVEPAGPVAPVAPVAPAERTDAAAGCHPDYDPCLPIVDDLNCSAVAAPVRVLGADPYHLDVDGDGIGCQ